jgi:hypothetical protein
VVLTLLLLRVLGLLGNGSGSDEGTTGSSPQELEQAQNSPQVPAPPVPPGTSTGGTCADGNDDVAPTEINRHHSTPMFMGGARNQPLTTMLRSEHVELHRELNRFLETKTDGEGHTMRYSCINKGDDIQENFTTDERLQALAEFYRGPGARFTQAAADFFAQHPGYR